ncbi:MAG: DUF4936 family protein [Janthinobacterium sp.]
MVRPRAFTCSSCPCLTCSTHSTCENAIKDLYVYYQVKEEHAQALEARVRAMQAKLAAASGVAPQLKRRPDSKDGLQTWMEIYPVVGEGFTELLAGASDEAGLLSLTAGVRHTEVFMDLPPCA